VFILVSLGATVVYPLRRLIVSILASDLSIIEETQRFLHVVLPLLPFFGICINVMSIGRGAGRTTIPSTVEIVRTWTIRIALGYFLAFTLGMGSMGIWIPFSLSNAIGGTALAIWAKYGKWDKAVIKTTPI